MAHARMTPALFDVVAARFKAFGEPTRLRILHALRDRERTVGEIGRATGIEQANLSRHLQQLHALGFVSRRRDGLFVRYRLADRDVLRLCDLMCGRVRGATAPSSSAR
jgi:DNA-binding transcriptional ArsR family regulator